jgi:hypothetical protein
VTSDDFDDYALFAGKYFGEGATRLEFSLGQSTEKLGTSSTTCTTFTGSCSTRSFSGEGSTSDTPSLAVMHVGRVRSATYALTGDVSEERARDALFDFDPPRTYFVGAELYPVPAVGVRLGYESVKSPAFDDYTISIGASWYFRRNVGLELALSREDIHDNSPFGDDDPRYTDGAALRVIGRL